jgi:transcriptional regulator with XRE-family HTH domain
LQRQQITYFETGARVPSLEQLIRIARALDVPAQRLLSGANRVGCAVNEIALELRSLGLADLWAENIAVPGAFRRPEEVVALAVSGKEPEARIIEGVPAVLAWNRWNGALLRTFARAKGGSIVFRFAWLADIALAIDRQGGFPGGCPGKEDLLKFVRRIKPPPPDQWDDLGRPGGKPPTSPLWKRWRISYAAELADFKRRAEGLADLAKAEGRSLSTWGE